MQSAPLPLSTEPKRAGERRHLLDACNAYIIGKTEAQNRTLSALARRVGFARIAPVLSGGPVVVDPSSRSTNYFLVHYRLGDDAMKEVIGALRANRRNSIRFAPIVLIIDDCPFETILGYIKFGFDDLISLPEDTAEMRQRLEAQLNSDRLYIETETYLGPDRRRMELPIAGGEKRNSIEHFHTCYIIRRTVGTGITIMRTSTLGQAA